MHIFQRVALDFTTTLAETRTRAMHEPFETTTPIRILEVEGLGYSAAMVTVEYETLLLLDVGLSEDQRIEIMTDAMCGRF